MKLWAALIKATMGTVMPRESVSKSLAPPSKMKKSVDGILASSIQNTSLPSTNNKLQELENLTSANLAKIKKIKSEYRQLVERVKKELERIKIEKLKKNI